MELGVALDIWIMFNANNAAIVSNAKKQKTIRVHIGIAETHDVVK